MTKYSKLVPTEKKEVKTVLTHSLNKGGDVVKNDNIRQKWDNSKLLDCKREGLDQFLSWDDDKKEYFILLGKKGTEFDNL